MDGCVQWLLDEEAENAGCGWANVKGYERKRLLRFSRHLWEPCETCVNQAFSFWEGFGYDRSVVCETCGKTLYRAAKEMVSARLILRRGEGKLGKRVLDSLCGVSYLARWELKKGTDISAAVSAWEAVRKFFSAREGYAAPSDWPWRGSAAAQALRGIKAEIELARMAREGVQMEGGVSKAGRMADLFDEIEDAYRRMETFVPEGHWVEGEREDIERMYRRKRAGGTSRLADPKRRHIEDRVSSSEDEPMVI